MLLSRTAELDAPHAQLECARRLIADGSCCLLSLDVFDTLLWRRVPRPTDIFGVLCARLRRQGNCPEWLTDASFRQMRIEAERSARLANRDSTEVSLFDIWRAMPLPLFDGLTLDDLVEAEVELEREFTVVDLDVARLVDLAHSSELPVILVSDTYFTDDQLTRLLDRPELEALKAARTFRSHQHGTDKASGLWKVVLQNVGLRPEQIVHVGDNEVADHTVPSELGVRTVHYQRFQERFHTVLHREGQVLDPFGPLDAHLDPDDGDWGLTSLRAKVMQAGSQQVEWGADTAWRYGASVLGPVLTGFAEWVALRAHETGTNVVWCPMREGEMLSDLVNNAARSRGWDVEAKPIWLSRQVTLIAALTCHDQQAMYEFINRTYKLTVAQLLSMFKLRPGDVPCLAERLHNVLDDPELVRRVSNALTETPHLRNKLAVTVSAARERLIRSLREAGALDNPELTLVDLGWGGTIQIGLARALERAGVRRAVSGLYLATDERSTPLYCAGLRAEGYLGQSGHPTELVQALSRSPEVVEQCTSALCGSLIDFDDDGAPVLGPTAGIASQYVERRSVRRGIEAFQQMWTRYVHHADGTWPLLTNTAKTRLRKVLFSALRAPTEDEAGLFGNWRHDDNFGSSVVTKIVPNNLADAIPYLSPSDLDELDMRDAFWPALVGASDTRLASAQHAVTTGALDPEIFEQSGPRCESQLRFRSSDGEWHDGPRQQVRINHNGLSFARMTVRANDVTDVSLAIPGRPAIVRIDWITAVVSRDGRPEAETLRWDSPEDFAGLTFADCTWLGGNLVEFYETYAAVWLPLASHVGDAVNSAQVSIGFAMLPQSMSRTAHRLPAASTAARLAGRLREEYRKGGSMGAAAAVARVAVRRLGAGQ